MTFERIPSPSHPLYAEAMALYGISFPAHEQREMPSQTAILTHPDYHFTAILDGGAFVGDMLYWETPDFRYIEHFCILPALTPNVCAVYTESDFRRRGIAGALLQFVCRDTHEKGIDTLYLLTDHTGFYERCGFTANPYPHVHPAYHKGIRGHDLVLMSRPDGLTDKQCRTFQTYLADVVMRNAY